MTIIMDVCVCAGAEKTNAPSPSRLKIYIYVSLILNNNMCQAPSTSSLLLLNLSRHDNNFFVPIIPPSRPSTMPITTTIFLSTTVFLTATLVQGFCPSGHRTTAVAPLAALSERQMQFWEDVEDGLRDIQDFHQKQGTGDIDRIWAFCQR